MGRAVKPLYIDYSQTIREKDPVLKEVSAPVYEYVKEENQRRRPLYDRYLMQKKILENKVSNLISTASKVSKEKKPAASMFDVFDAQQELSNLEEVTLLKLIVDDITPEAMVKVMKENDEKIAMVTAEEAFWYAGRKIQHPAQYGYISKGLCGRALLL